MREIKEYLHLYCGSQCVADGNEFTLCGVEITDTGTLAYDGTMVDGIHQCWWVENCDFKLLLRPLSDTTEGEADFRWNNFINIKEINQQVVAEEIRWLLSKHFDLFNLIEDGLALDKTKIPA